MILSIIKHREFGHIKIVLKNHMQINNKRSGNGYKIKRLGIRNAVAIKKFPFQFVFLWVPYSTGNCFMPCHHMYTYII